VSLFTISGFWGTFGNTVQFRQEIEGNGFMFSSIPIGTAFALPRFCGKFGLPDGPRIEVGQNPVFSSHIAKGRCSLRQDTSTMTSYSRFLPVTGKQQLNILAFL